MKFVGSRSGAGLPSFLTLLLTLLACRGPVQIALGARNGVTCQVLNPPLKMGGQICSCRPCHACEFNPKLAKCTFVQSQEPSLSDGSEVPIKQPVTALSAWFLSEDEITQSRGGVSRDDLTIYTTGNLVSAFVAPEEFFHAVFQDVRATASGDRIFLTSWTVDNTPFEPKADPTGEISSFQNIFGHAFVRGAEFYALAHANFWEKTGNMQVRDYINGLGPSPNGGKAKFLFDDRLAVPGSTSNHQKTLVIENRNDRIAYVGGIDLTSGRWDDLAHTQKAGWMDCHLRVIGPAASDVSTNFLTRWNSSAKPGDSFTGKMHEFVNPDTYSLLPAILSNNPPAHGRHAVQIVRTYHSSYSKFEAAPKGERSLFDARVKAIRNAKNYIYIEDQYFVLVAKLLEELMAVLPGLQRLIVVAQSPGSDDGYSLYKKLLHDMAAPMQLKYPNKFQLYTTKKARNIYVHTKLVLIDDVYLSIGSANWNDNSMFLDSELNANVVDEELVTSPDGVQVGKLVLDYRTRKFVELTGKSYEMLSKMTFLEAANQLDAATKDPASILADLEPEEQNYAPL